MISYTYTDDLGHVVKFAGYDRLGHIVLRKDVPQDRTWYAVLQMDDDGTVRYDSASREHPGWHHLTKLQYGVSVLKLLEYCRRSGFDAFSDERPWSLE